MGHTQGLWAWFLQRVSAALLIFFLGTHFFVLHFVPGNIDINFAGVQTRLQSALFIVVDLGLLVTGLYHGLNGVRAVVLDWWPRLASSITWVLWIVGVAATVYGWQTLLVFLR
ncbi:MAG: succinate dehydrogenase [Firmicutes bacterium]|nr:succinate dehydrogenase [Bacillota bacterium]MCL5040558.1 succinate dehydrogenase [Bacillota bacterium]